MLGSLFYRLRCCLGLFGLTLFVASAAFASAAGNASAVTRASDLKNLDPHMCVLFFNKTNYYDVQKEEGNQVVKPNPVSLEPTNNEYYNVNGKDSVLKKVFSNSKLDQTVKCNKMRQLMRGKVFSWWNTDDCTNYNYLCINQPDSFACVINVSSKSMCDQVSKKVSRYFAQTREKVLSCMDEHSCSVHHIPGRPPRDKQDFYVGPAWLDLSKSIRLASLKQNAPVS